MVPFGYTPCMFHIDRSRISCGGAKVQISRGSLGTLALKPQRPRGHPRDCRGVPSVVIKHDGPHGPHGEIPKRMVVFWLLGKSLKPTWRTFHGLTLRATVGIRLIHAEGIWRGLYDPRWWGSSSSSSSSSSIHEAPIKYNGITGGFKEASHLHIFTSLILIFGRVNHRKTETPETIFFKEIYWLVVWTPLNNISQLGWLETQYMGK